MRMEPAAFTQELFCILYVRRASCSLGVPAALRLPPHDVAPTQTDGPQRLDPMPTLVAVLAGRRLWAAVFAHGFFSIVFSGLVFGADAAGTGTLRGRVINASTGNFINHARVVVAGAAIEALTDANGDYRLTGVPAGEVTVVANVIGLESQSTVIRVVGGGTVEQDFSLGVVEAGAGQGGGKPIRLDPMSVTARALSGQAVALTEQRNAANIKSVIALDEFVDMADGNVGEFIKFVSGLDIQ